MKMLFEAPVFSSSFTGDISTVHREVQIVQIKPMHLEARGKVKNKLWNSHAVINTNEIGRSRALPCRRLSTAGFQLKHASQSWNTNGASVRTFDSYDCLERWLGKSGECIPSPNNLNAWYRRFSRTGFRMLPRYKMNWKWEGILHCSVPERLAMFYNQDH